MSERDEREHVSISEAAEILSVSERTVFNWIKSGKLKAEKRDGRTILNAEQVFRIKGNENLSYDPEKHVLIDREAFSEIMKELQSSRQWMQESGYRIGQLEVLKDRLEDQVKLLEDKRSWWKRWRRK